MTEQTNQVDTTAAEAYENFMVPGLFGPWVHKIVQLAAPQAGEHVLDVACGTGTASRLVAELVTASGKVVGLDIDPGMIEVARSRPASSSGAAVEWHCGSALEIPFENDLFDAVLCLQGLQYFPDKVAGLAEMLRVMKPEGRLAANVWRTIEHCKGHAALAQILERWGVDAGAARKPFSLGESDEVQRLAREAGFRDVKISTVNKPAHFTSPQHFIESLASGAPSTRHALAKVPEQERSKLIEEVSTALERYVETDGVSIPYACHLLLARP
jgi:SAM-dependent methyltransferase